MFPKLSLCKIQSEPIFKFRFGQLSLLLAGLGLSYYTAWVILLPFVEPDYQPLVARFGTILATREHCLMS